MSDQAGWVFFTGPKILHKMGFYSFLKYSNMHQTNMGILFEAHSWKEHCYTPQSPWWQMDINSQLLTIVNLTVGNPNNNNHY